MKPVRAGTLRWSAADLEWMREQSKACVPPPVATPQSHDDASPPPASAVAAVRSSDPRSPVRGRTLQWSELRDALLVARQIAAGEIPPPEDLPPDAAPPGLGGVDLFDELPVDDLLGSLAAASLVPRASLAAQTALRARVSSDPVIESEDLPGDLVSAICAAIADEPE